MLFEPKAMVRQIAYPWVTETVREHDRRTVGSRRSPDTCMSKRSQHKVGPCREPLLSLNPEMT
jgi:hypothetical protein